MRRNSRKLKQVPNALLFSALFLALISFPLPAMAGECRCADANDPGLICYKNTSDEASCNTIKQLTDKQWISLDSGAISAGPQFKTCKYYPNSNCGSFGFFSGGRVYDGPEYLDKLGDLQFICNNDICTKVPELTCQDDIPCQTYLGVCRKGVCYLPPAGKQKYDSLPKFLGIKADLQIKKPAIEIRLPGLTFSEVKNTLDEEGNITIPYFAEYLSAAYKFAMVAASILAVIMIVVQGAKIVTSGGGEAKLAAYKRVGQIVIGLGLVWGSYFILYNINPALVNFKVFKVKYIQPQPLINDRAADNEDNPSVGGKGDTKAADGIACPKLTPGTKFNGAFTTYYNLSPKSWGEAGKYKGIYKGSDPSLQDKGVSKGDFFCAVSMECGCPNGYLGSKDCGVKKPWPACKFFDANTKFCDTSSGKYTPGTTVAASTCFPKNCTFKVDDQHTLKVTDRGSGIIGTHFDLYLGVDGEANFVKDTSWLKTDNLEIINCGGTISKTELENMRKSYERRKPGVCKPGINC